MPVGNAAGDPYSSWLNPTSLLIGVLAVATAAYLAAVFLCADAARLGEETLEQGFRTRALQPVSSVRQSRSGLAVLRSDAHVVYHRLVEGRGLVGLLASIVAGSATLALIWLKRYEASRYTAALAVAAIIGGWALAQSPIFLEGLTVRDAAAGGDTLVAVVVAVVAGGAILFPRSRCSFDSCSAEPSAAAKAQPAGRLRRALCSPSLRRGSCRGWQSLVW